MVSPLSVLWRACAAQALVVGAAFLVLTLLLPRSFFRDYGAVAGPLAWLACSLVSGRLLRLPGSRAPAAAVASGAIGAAANLIIGHTGGLLVGVLAFGTACSLLTTRGGGTQKAGERPAWRRLTVGATPSPDPSRHSAGP
jgi:hypothetical protein